MARHSNAAIASLVIAGMSLGACSFAPRHERPDLPTPGRYADSYVDDPASGTQAIALGWRDFFADPRLEALIATALKNNRDLVIAVAQIEEARGLYRIQRSELLPTIAV